MIKNKIKYFLRKKDMKQFELADKLGIKKETLSRIINGNPTIQSIKDIADALDVEVVELFESKGPNGFIEYNGTNHPIRSFSDLNELVSTINKNKKTL
ncbi:helix-turn-helix transcriptional regulator [Arenibacter sp. GZD96]|uniref:helix-turn-helix domain-containing protein n=1 Tax=Aurantibrevibacter litoralis TaxID=3106030 RepID=UPI002AFFF6B1|nr:helix-turn-helix transcriptional regulator [Arenibacter sp. GZD-96]MEA1784726.1 helix-turn-helix transcriptional regulator [Arenibacter sp. GZD-96]